MENQARDCQPILKYFENLLLCFILHNLKWLLSKMHGIISNMKRPAICICVASATLSMKTMRAVNRRIYYFMFIMCVRFEDFCSFCIPNIHILYICTNEGAQKRPCHRNATKDMNTVSHFT